MTLNWEDVRLPDEEMPRKAPTGALDDYDPHVIDLLFRATADAASRRALGECIEDLEQRAAKCREIHYMVCSTSDVYLTVAQEWQKILAAAEGKGE